MGVRDRVLAILAIGGFRIKEEVYVLRKAYPRTCEWHG